MGSEYQEKTMLEMQTRTNSDRLNEGGEDTKDYDWSGPGLQGTRHRTEKKNEKLVNAAIFQLKFNTTIPPLFEFEEGSGSTEDQHEDQQLLEAIQKIAPFDDDFSRRAGAVEDAYHQAVVASMMGDTESAMQNFRRVNRLGEPIIQDILKKLKKLQIHNVGFIPGYLPAIYQYRSMARLNLGDFNGSIEDATESIRLWWSKTMRTTAESGDDDVNVDAKIVHILAFMTRARASRNLGFLEQAVTDFRGCCAAIRAFGTRYNRQPSIKEATVELLHTLAMIKHRDQASRPHYTNEERENWERELGIGDYQHDNFHCANCNALRSDSVKLMICNRCKKKWFCSKECLTHAWKYKGHKAECKELEHEATNGAFYEADEETITKMTASVRDKGVAVLSGNMFLLYDGKRYEYFDSLTNDSFLVHRPTTTTVGFIRNKI